MARIHGQRAGADCRWDPSSHQQSLWEIPWYLNLHSPHMKTYLLVSMRTMYSDSMILYPTWTTTTFSAHWTSCFISWTLFYITVIAHLGKSLRNSFVRFNEATRRLSFRRFPPPSVFQPTLTCVSTTMRMSKIGEIVSRSFSQPSIRRHKTVSANLNRLPTFYSLISE